MTHATDSWPANGGDLDRWVSIIRRRQAASEKARSDIKSSQSGLDRCASKPGSCGVCQRRFSAAMPRHPPLASG
jgi:hypothetical protein